MALHSNSETVRNTPSTPNILFIRCDIFAGQLLAVAEG
jgi:hypothetical protein